jgi:hypothetical protein
MIAMSGAAKRDASLEGVLCASRGGMVWLTKRAVALAVATMLLACGRAGERTDDRAEATPQPQLPALPIAEPPLDRRALLRAISEAASARAAGTADLQAQRLLDGMLFEVRFRFGCPGDEGESRRWTFDAQEHALRFRIEPEVIASTPLIEQLGLSGVESVFGFGIERPWMLDASCPAEPPDKPDEDPGRPTPAPDEHLASNHGGANEPLFAVAQFFSDQDSRTHLGSERPLSTTARLAEGEVPGGSGYDLVLSGRLERLADGRVIACKVQHSDESPACVVSARFDRIAITKPGGGVIAEWATS